MLDESGGTKGYSVEILHLVASPLTDADNVDVVVTLESGERFSATFFTLKNIELLLRRYRETGECGGGLYFYTTDMIIVECLTADVIRKSVSDLVESGEFRSAMKSIGFSGT
jgi:hypothetical protein